MRKNLLWVQTSSFWATSSPDSLLSLLLFVVSSFKYPKNVKQLISIIKIEEKKKKKTYYGHYMHCQVHAQCRSCTY